MIRNILVGTLWLFSSVLSAIGAELQVDVFQPVNESVLDLDERQEKIMQRLRQDSGDVQVVFFTGIQSDTKTLKFNSGAGSINLNTSIELELNSVRSNATGSLTNHGIGEEFKKFGDQKNDENFIISSGNDMSGAIYNADTVVSIRPLGNGLHALITRELEDFPDDHPPEIPQEPSQQDVDNLIEFNNQLDPDGAAPILDIFIVFDAGITDVTANPKLLALSSVNSVEEIFENSRIDAMINLIGVQILSDRASPNIISNLKKLIRPNDGVFDDIDEQLAINADAIIMIASTGFFCGKAEKILADAGSNYAIVRHDCSVENFSFAHELAHLMGARHEFDKDPKAVPFPFGHGFHLGSRNSRTIMATKAGCDCFRRPYFSSPELTLMGETAGDAETSNNSRAISETIKIFSLKGE